MASPPALLASKVEFDKPSWGELAKSSKVEFDKPSWGELAKSSKVDHDKPAGDS